MIAWAEPMADREDARTQRLLDWVQENVKPNGAFTDERVIVFSEYRATQRYLQERLIARGIGGERVELLDGTTSEEERERIKSQWQEPPADYPVRVLLATDAASEGISLQRHCHLLGARRDPVEPEPARSSATAGSTATASRRPRCSCTTASAPAGRPRSAGRWRAISTSSRAW